MRSGSGQRCRPQCAVGFRVSVRVEGTVQGVGFRPYVHRLACGLGLSGYVLNDASGVLLEIEGGCDAVEAFLVRLGPDAPPLAVPERVAVLLPDAPTAAWIPSAPVDRDRLAGPLPESTVYSWVSD